MRDEHKVVLALALIDDLLERHDIALQELRLRGRDGGDVLVRVDRAAADAREVLERKHHVLLLVALCGSLDELGCLLRIRAEGARVVSHVSDRRKVDIEAELLELLRRLAGRLLRARYLTAPADLLLRRRRRQERLAAHDLAALLIDADEERHLLVRLRLQVRDELLRLVGRLHVAVK